VTTDPWTRQAWTRRHLKKTTVQEKIGVGLVLL